LSLIITVIYLIQETNFDGYMLRIFGYGYKVFFLKNFSYEVKLNNEYLSA